MKEQGLLYFLLEPELKRLKIGWSGRSVHERIKAFQTGNSQPLCLIGMIQGTQADERALHRRFDRHRVLGRAEWFQAVPEVMEQVLALIEEKGMLICQR